MREDLLKDWEHEVPYFKGFEKRKGVKGQRWKEEENPTQEEIK